MLKTARYITLIVAAHAAVVGLHTLAHVQMGIYVSLLGNVFIASFIIVGPFVAMFLAWTRLRRAAPVLLVSAMAGSLLFGVYNHFLVIGPDHIPHVPPGKWERLFDLTAVLLAVTEGLGCAVGVWAMRATHRALTVSRTG